MLNAQAYAAASEELAAELQRFTAEESDYYLSLWRQLLPMEINVASITTSQVYAAAMSRPFQGRLLREWAASIEADRMVKIRDTIRMGFVEGQTIPQMVQKIRGTRALKYTDGILEIHRRHAEAVARTAVQHVAATARQSFFEANSDVIKAIRWSATLDSRTSETCRLRDGKEYNAVTYKPIGHSLPWLGGPGKAHWGCRSAAAPVLKDWDELGLGGGGTRASMDGQVPADTTYGEWLRKQSAARQDEILGPARAALYRKGGLEIEQFANEKGRWLTLKELQERHASAFRRAGL